jgi:hypothetical protein
MVTFSAIFTENNETDRALGFNRADRYFRYHLVSYSFVKIIDVYSLKKFAVHSAVAASSVENS